MTSPRLTGSRWLVLAAAPVLAFALWIAVGTPGPEQLRLPREITLSTVTVVAVTAVSLGVTLAMCAWRTDIGMPALTGVLVAIAGFWPVVQQNQFSGPVIANLGPGHGLHRNDALAVVPAALGAAAFVGARRARRARRTC